MLRLLQVFLRLVNAQPIKVTLTMLSLMLVCGCVSQGATGSVKTAWKMLQNNRENLGPPSPVEVEHVTAEIGIERFVHELEPLVTSKYRAEALYSLGWFGNVCQVSCVANALSDGNAEVRRIALRSLCRLTGESFLDVHTAEIWWAEHRSEFVPCRSLVK
ncbi:MAG: hypothetical protein FLDDKLPJ_03310 [Phycisphaerae bacterium]|nr:hypothetical protein [Phycisphaerae bacterium]